MLFCMFPLRAGASSSATFAYVRLCTCTEKKGQNWFQGLATGSTWTGTKLCNVLFTEEQSRDFYAYNWEVAMLLFVSLVSVWKFCFFFSEEVDHNKTENYWVENLFTLLQWDSCWTHPTRPLTIAGVMSST